MNAHHAAVIDALHDGIMTAWDWAVIEEQDHGAAGRSMAVGALKCLEDQGFKVVRRNDA